MKWYDLLLLVARLATALVAKIKAAKRQKASTAIDADPVSWSNDHFCGVCDKNDKTPDPTRHICGEDRGQSAD